MECEVVFLWYFGWQFPHSLYVSEGLSPTAYCILLYLLFSTIRFLDFDSHVRLSHGNVTSCCVYTQLVPNQDRSNFLDCTRR